MTVNRNKTLSVFDFDETLVMSEEHQVLITHASGKESRLASNDWVHYVPQPGDNFDFSAFETLVNPEKNLHVWNIFTARLQDKSKDVIVLSARERQVPLLEFFFRHQLHPHVVCLGIKPGENNGIHKARWISEEIDKGHYRYKEVEFYDDRDDNISEVLRLKAHYFNIHWKIHKVVKEHLISF